MLEVSKTQQTIYPLKLTNISNVCINYLVIFTIMDFANLSRNIANDKYIYFLNLCLKLTKPMEIEVPLFKI